MHVYQKTTCDISIIVTPAFMEHQSDVKMHQYAFSYTVQIVNRGEKTAQLLRRHWIITSGGKLFEEVKGDGVVGFQPTLKKGEGFEYTSGAVIQDLFGAMKGTYTFVKENGSEFEVEIPEFDLIYHSAIN